MKLLQLNVTCEKEIDDAHVFVSQQVGEQGNTIPQQWHKQPPGNTRTQ